MQVDLRQHIMHASIPHILLVEDDATHVDLIRRAMASATAPACLTVARSVQEAQTILATCVPDLLLVD